jgi:hypothetical protein
MTDNEFWTEARRASWSQAMSARMDPNADMDALKRWWRDPDGWQPLEEEPSTTVAALP